MFRLLDKTIFRLLLQKMFRYMEALLKKAKHVADIIVQLSSNCDLCKLMID